MIKGIIFVLFNSIIPYSTIISPDSKFAYDIIGVLLHIRIKIGRNVVIEQNVIIGRNLALEGRLDLRVRSQAKYLDCIGSNCVWR